MNVGMVALQERLHATDGPLAPADAARVRAHPAHGVALLQAAGITDASLAIREVLHTSDAALALRLDQLWGALACA